MIMNKNLAAYLWFYLTQVAKMDATLVKTIVKATIDPTFARDIDLCK